MLHLFVGTYDLMRFWMGWSIVYVWGTNIEISRRNLVVV